MKVTTVIKQDGYLDISDDWPKMEGGSIATPML